MQFHGQNVTYTQAEVDEYYTLWQSLIAANPGLEEETARLRDIGLLEDESALIEDRSQYSPEIRRHEEMLSALVLQIRPGWDQKKLKDFSFYANFHSGRSLAFDLFAATRQARERPKSKNT